MTQYAEMAVGWALHALEPDEEEEFLTHLASCVECERLVAETAATFEVLARGDDTEEPPPSLRTRILDAAAEEAGDDQRPAVPAASTSLTPATVVAADPAAAPVVPQRRRTRLLAAAASVAVLAALGGLVAANQAVSDERDRQAAAAADAQRVVSVLAEAGAPGATHATLTSPSGGYLGLVVDTGGVPTVLTTGLAGNREDQTYVLWGVGRAAKAPPVPIGAFDVPGSGPSVRSVPSTPQADPFAGYALSLEPGRVAPASPTDVVASGQVGR